MIRFVLLVPLLSSACCWSIATGLTFVSRDRQAIGVCVPQQNRLAKTCLRAKEDDIRELEEKLKRLKEEAKQEDKEAKEADNIPELNDEAVYTELLTEKWKENDEESKGGSVLQTAGTAVAALGLLAALTFFAQVPVGQENLNRYSAAPASREIDLGDLDNLRSGNDLI